MFMPETDALDLWRYYRLPRAVVSEPTTTHGSCVDLLGFSGLLVFLVSFFFRAFENLVRFRRVPAAGSAARM